MLIINTVLPWLQGLMGNPEKLQNKQLLVYDVSLFIQEIPLPKPGEWSYVIQITVHINLPLSRRRVFRVFRLCRLHVKFSGTKLELIRHQ